LSTKKPPSSGPITVATPKTAPKKLARRDDVPDDRDRRDDEPTAADSLQRPERDQLGHVLRDPAESGADEEDDDRPLEQPLASVQVAELAVERADDGRREEVRRDDP
jgi:hypothetical protein